AGNISQAKAVTLDINNLDEVAPTITSADTAVTLNENSGAEQVIYTATAHDSLDISAGVTFSLSAESDSALTIDENTGEVTLTTDLDHETQSQYSFAVIATDVAGNASEAQSVTLDINDLDDAAPSITSDATAVAIDENSGAGQVVYTATADDSADDVADTPIIYSLAEGSDTALSIDSATGSVTLNTNPDHEAQSQYSFAVIATDNAGNASEAQPVTLDINDLDDAAPAITSGATAIAIDENSGAGQVIYTVTADDSADDVSDTPITYSLAEGSDTQLSIDASTGEVTLTADPDYETQNQFSFAVIATDAAGNTSAAQSVTLDINNLDEVAPTITSGDSAAVLESSDAGALVYQALADDSADVSTGVTFSLSEDSDVALSIDPVTGEVTLADEPDFAAKPSYSFTVIADDGVNQSQKAVSLSVVDQDLEAPVFTSSATVAIDENIGENQVIYTAITEDESLVQYSLSEDSDVTLSINSDTGQVSLSANPDHETQSQYSFTVIATDFVENTSEQAVAVTVNDLDDAAPTVTSGAVADAIDENSGAGQVIYTVTADDSDDDVAATPITYSLTEDSDAGISINSSTGEVNLTANPDHETQSEYSFAVVATDAAGNTSEAQSVTLDINDLDDAAPTVTSGATAVAINENSGAGQVVYTAASTDSGDDVADSPIAYSLTQESDAGLTIDESSGAVTLTVDPDYEIQPQYSFAVIATDGAGNSSAAQSVTLNINNLDDTAPVITSDDTADAIDENTVSEQVIYSASSDDSADVSGGVSYSLNDTTEYSGSNADSGSDSGSDTGPAESVISIPELAAATQHVYVSSSTKSEDGSQETVVVSYNADDTTTTGLGLRIHFDSSVLSASDITTLMTNDLLVNAVVESDDNDLDGDASTDTYVAFGWASLFGQWPNAAPVDLASITFDIAEGASGSSAINFMSSSNAAGFTFEGQTHQIAITGEAAPVDSSPVDSQLSINPATGEVTLNTDPDYETQSAYSFEVVATDVAGNASDAKAVTLDINNLDEVAPTITSDATAVAIDENSGAGQIIYTAAADDSADISDDVIFSLSEDSDAELTIDASTGEVILSADPDYETQSQYSFSVVATDAAGNASEAQAVTLDINNLDEVSPVITSSASESIDENIGANQLIYTATADDSADISDSVSYSFVDTTVYSGSDAGSDAGSGSDTGSDTGPAESVISIPDLAAATQHVYVSSSTKSEDGSQETVVVSYNADDTTTTGLGLRIHFDSSALSASDIATLMTNDLLVNAVVESDDNDLDGDASTDTYVQFGWASLFGAWPNAAPADLASITFDIAEGATGSSAINFTISSNAAGFAFDGQNHQVAITAEAAPDESSSDDSTLVESQLSF
ncbi:cadherin repeat domain-containing protein, partial [bacterium]|nr:cadherin repeat domain-containing protein [bacterium]